MTASLVADPQPASAPYCWRLPRTDAGCTSLGHPPTVGVPCPECGPGTYAAARDAYAAAGLPLIEHLPDLTPTCNGCDAIGPIHPVTGYCAPCQADAELDAEAAREIMADPGAHLPAIVAFARSILNDN